MAFQLQYKALAENLKFLPGINYYSIVVEIGVPLGNLIFSRKSSTNETTTFDKIAIFNIQAFGGLLSPSSGFGYNSAIKIN